MPVTPICFMIMPYNTKATQRKVGSAAPEQVNFNRLWDAAIRPAIVALGYEPVRADQDVGALIIKEMIERLAISDLVIADVSIPNGNVYYELGVRHAAKQTGCVMVSADWAEPLFDIDQLRQIRYPLPAQEVDDATAKLIQDKLTSLIPKLAAGATPVYEYLPGYPDNVNPERASAFRQTLQQLSEFQAAVHAARCAVGGQCKDRALALRQQYYSGGPVQKSVALELVYLLRDCAGWPEVLDFINALPEDMRELPVVQEQKALAVSNDGDHATAIGALLELIRLVGDSSERRGLLGGRYKRLYQATKDSKYLSQAIDQYERGMKLDLNNYYPSSNLPRLYSQRNRAGDKDKARVAAAVTLVGCERARTMSAEDPWLKPTLLGAAFDSGDVEKARELADEVRDQGPAAWQLASALGDMEVALGFHDGETLAGLKEILAELRGMGT